MAGIALNLGRLLSVGVCTGLVSRSYAVTAKSKEMAGTTPTNIYGFTVKNIKGEEVSLEKYRGFVLIIVNVASQCGLTDTNYKQLAELDTKYHEKGLRILAFPCNQFGHQEPGGAEEIMCTVNKYKVHFDMFEKIDVNGETAHPLYKYLKDAQKGTLLKMIKWNFTKFIISKEGVPVSRHSSTTEPSKLASEIEKLLDQ